MNHHNINSEAISALKEQLQESLLKFEKGRKAGNSQRELNQLYQAIKKLKQQIDLSQSELRKAEG
jgi:hypothetical protein